MEEGEREEEEEGLKSSSSLSYFFLKVGPVDLFAHRSDKVLSSALLFFLDLPFEIKKSIKLDTFF